MILLFLFPCNPHPCNPAIKYILFSYHKKTLVFPVVPLSICNFSGPTGCRLITTYLTANVHISYFWVWIISLGITSSIHFPTNFLTSFFNILFIYFFIKWCLGCFPYLVIVNRTPINIVEEIPLRQDEASTM